MISLSLTIVRGNTASQTLKIRSFSCSRRLLTCDLLVFCYLDSFLHLRVQLEIVLPLIILPGNTNLR